MKLCGVVAAGTFLGKIGNFTLSGRYVLPTVAS